MFTADQLRQQQWGSTPLVSRLNPPPCIRHHLIRCALSSPCIRRAHPHHIPPTQHHQHWNPPRNVVSSSHPRQALASPPAEPRTRGTPHPRNPAPAEPRTRGTPHPRNPAPAEPRTRGTPHPRNPAPAEPRYRSHFITATDDPLPGRPAALAS